MMRLQRGALAEAEADFEAAAPGERLLLPLESAVVDQLLTTQVQRGLNARKSQADPREHFERARQNLPRLRETIAQHGAPFGWKAEDYALLVAQICRDAGWGAEGLEFLDLCEARQAPNSRTLMMRGDLLRLAAVPELFRALDCYQRALASDPPAEDERRELEERVRETRRQIQQRAAEFALDPAPQDSPPQNSQPENSPPEDSPVQQPES
jgi:hypothetical protein